MTFHETLELSKQYEIGFSKYLQSRGYFVLPTYDYSGLGDGKAPMLQGLDSYVLPDLLVFNQGVSSWYEIKVKTRADYYRKTQRYVTGINKRHYEHYLKVKAITNAQVWLIFFHQHEREIRYCEVSEPYHHIYTSNKMGQDGMVFYDYLKMKILNAKIVI